MLHTFSLYLLITSVYQVPTDNILIRSLIQWDFFPHWIRAILLSFIFLFCSCAHMSVYLKLESLSLPLLKYTYNPIFFTEHTRAVFMHAEGERETLSVAVSNCVNPFKKDVFQFPGLPLPHHCRSHRHHRRRCCLSAHFLYIPTNISRLHVLALNILFSNNKYPERVCTCI